MQLLEFGLEARREKSVLAQIMLSIGVPNWTVQLWQHGTPEVRANGTHYYQQVVSKSGSIVLQRATWEVLITEPMLTLKGADFYRHLQSMALEDAWPQMVYYRMHRADKPQYLQMDEPLSVEVFRADVQKTSKKTFVLTEMLPEMDQLCAMDHAGEKYVSEYVLEIRT
jgi:hypothetical protein